MESYRERRKGRALQAREAAERWGPVHPTDLFKKFPVSGAQIKSEVEFAGASECWVRKT